MTYRIFALGGALAITACSPSPLTDSHIVLSGATRGEVPRDANGEPILDRTRPVPSSAIVAPPSAPTAPRR